MGVVARAWPSMTIERGIVAGSATEIFLPKSLSANPAPRLSSAAPIVVETAMIGTRSLDRWGMTILSGGSKMTWWS